MMEIIRVWDSIWWVELKPQCSRISFPLIIRLQGGRVLHSDLSNSGSLFLISVKVIPTPNSFPSAHRWGNITSHGGTIRSANHQPGIFYFRCTRDWESFHLRASIENMMSRIWLKKPSESQLNQRCCVSFDIDHFIHYNPRAAHVSLQEINFVLNSKHN